MLKSQVKCENLTKNNILCRASLRGLKKCTSCGFINGQRALICRNVNCDLRIKRLAAIKPFDPIQLITYGRTKLYSLRSKEKLLQPRNFVSITETVESVESPPSAVCYVDNCKYDAFEPTHLVCRHIKACKVLTDVAVAEVYPIDKSILWNLNIPLEQKQHLWDLYQLEEKLIHPVQKLNACIFVVKCIESKMFPAGRLHVTVFSNMMPPNKSGNFSCSCKKLKLILEPDNSVTMKQEICDHLLLLLAAILNKPEGKTLYGKFLDLLQYLWMPTNLNTSIVDDCVTARQSQFMDYDLGLEKCKESIKVENDNSDDLFNFTEELFAENNIPDFSDIILDVNNEKSNNVQSYKKSPTQMTTTLQEMHIKDPKLNAGTTISINDEDMDLNFPHITTPESTVMSTNTNASATPNNMDFSESGLSVIEQFQLNHNMQVSNDNIELAKDIENLNNLESQVMESSSTSSVNIFPKQTSLLKTPIASSNLNNNTEGISTKSPCIVINSNNCNTTVPVQKSIVLKQGPVKIIKIATPIQKLNMEKNTTNKIIQISKINPNKIIVLKSNQNEASVNNKQLMLPTVTVTTPSETTLPALSYESWLEHIIELINDSITVQDSPTVKNHFHVPEAIFNHFSKTFTLNNKRRLPNTTSVIKSGKYKDLIKYTWYLNQASTVQRIFSSKNLKIELERSYQRLNDGSFELYTPAAIQLTENNNFRPIYPKLQLYKAFIQFTNNAELSTNNLQSEKCGLKLEWLPSAFPKSNFGLMTIEFCVSVKEPEVTL